MRLVRVTHGSCPHSSESWTLALAAALSHANLTMDPRSRKAIIPLLMRGETVRHHGVQIKGRVVDE